MKLLSVLIFLVLLHAFTMAQKSPVVLVVTGGHDFNRNEFEGMLDSLPEKITYKIAELPAAFEFFEKKHRDDYDVIVFYHMWQDISADIPAEYAKYIRTLDFVGSTGPLWFALALLVFSIIYALIRKTVNPAPFSETVTVKIGSVHNIAVGMLISVLTFLMRIPFPIGTNILNMQLCFFSQYIILFILGIYFFRKKLLLTLSYSQGMKWFRYTLVFGTIFWFGMTLVGDAPHKGLEPFVGHLTWGNAAYSFWESFFCVGVCLGLIVWFREKFNKQGPLTKFLSDNAFGVYVFHTPILVFISMLMKDVALYPFFKYLIVATITIPLTFAVSYLLRKIPGVAYIIR